ncbi:MAG: cysteine desulfurase-like protein [Gemmatimonadota bacterium]|nr:cysteine desulfurase-like protein [Gemmatimonadota bacterium]
MSGAADRAGAPAGASADTLVPEERIRARFPALARAHGPWTVAYFDGPGGTQVPRSVVEASADYLLRHNANTHWGFPTSAETDAVLAAAREALADLLGGAPDEVAFGANMTTLTFHFARAVGRGLAPGAEIVVTELDHHANVDPWRDLARERGLVVRTVPFHPEAGTLDWDAFAAAVGPRTALVALGAASNALGTVNDVARAAALARDAGALLFVDAVHSAAHLPTDVTALGCDALACSAYKFYGPHVGVLWVKRDIAARLDAPRLAPADDAPPFRLETGTLNHEGIAGAAAAVEFLASLPAREGGDRRDRLRRALRGLHARGEALVTQLWAGLGRIEGVRRFGPAPGTAPRTPTISFTVDGMPAAEVSARLAERFGVFCSWGDFYATTVARRLGVAEAGGLVRAGCACYTTADEVRRLLGGVEAIAGGARGTPGTRSSSTGAAGLP